MFNDQGSLKQYDAIVIGAGISGLTSALILAKEGLHVAIFERDGDVAPLIRPYKRKGCEISPGLHVSGWMDAAGAIFSLLKYLNVRDEVETELSENGYGSIIIGSKKYHIPKGYENVEKALIEYFPESAQAVRNYLRLVREVNDKSFYFNHTLSPSADKVYGFTDISNYTLKDCLKQFNTSHDLMNMLGTLSYMLIGSRADEVPFIIHAFVLGGFYRAPGFFTIKGINRLLSNYKRELARYGVDLFTNSEVDEILIGESKNAVGIKLNSGEEYFAPKIVASFNPKLLSEKVKKNIFRPIFKRRLQEAENTFGMYVAFFKVEGYKDIEIENFVIYDENLDINLGTTMNHSGEELTFCVFLMDNNKSFPLDDEERKKREKEKFFLMEKIIYQEIPGLKGRTVLLDYLKPWSFERYTKTVNGSAYGVKQTMNAIGFQHKVPVRGLYLVGQAIYPGVLGAMISSFSLAFEVLESDKFWAKVQNP